MGGVSGNFFDSISQQHLGSGSDAGSLGTGQYRSDMYNADPRAFSPDANEQSFIEMLQARANGNSPSAAELQMRQGMDQASRQAQAIAASQRGISPALAARYAAQSQAQMAQQNNAQTGILRAQEQAGAMGDLGNELRSVRTGRENFQSLDSGNYNQNNALNERGYTAAAANRGNMAGGLFNSMGAGAISSLFAKGGMVMPRMYADGGDVFSLPTPISLGGADPVATVKYAQVKMGAHGKPNGSAGGYGSFGDSTRSAGNGPAYNATSISAAPFADGGQVDDSFRLPADSSGGSDPVATGWQKSGGGGGGGGMGALMALLARGGRVPGQAAVHGNSFSNDTVPAILSPGEIVLPRSVTTAENAPEKAKEFVKHIQKMKIAKKKSSDGPNYAELLKATREMGAVFERLGKKSG